MKDSLASFKKSKWFPLIMGIISLVLGVIGLINPKMRMESIALVAGIVFLIYGLLQIINGIAVKDNTALRVSSIIFGLIMIVLAILDFANLGLVGKYLPTLAGLFMIVNALSNLIPSFKLMKNGIKSWWLSALPAVILLILGILFILLPGYIGQAFGTPEFSEVLVKEFTAFRSESIDFGIMEKAKHIYTIPGSFGWDDVGSWLAVERINETDDYKNYIDGDVVTVDTQRTTICGGKRLIAAIGTRDIIIVDTDDVLLVCSKNNTQDVKKVIAQLKEQNRNEFV